MGLFNLLFGTGHDRDDEEELIDTIPDMTVEELANLSSAQQEQREDLKNLRSLIDFVQASDDEEDDEPQTNKWW